jgi:uncharacterized protein YjlB
MGLEPETYYIEPTEYAPNSPMPVLVYRAVLPKPITEENASTFLEANNWEKRVRHHLHSTTFSRLPLTFKNAGDMGVDRNKAFPPQLARMLR